MSAPSVKRCRICEEEKSTSEFYRQPQNRDNLKHECKACESDLSKARAKKIEATAAVLPDTAEKTCSKCGETKLVTDFKRRKDSKDGYRNDCRKCTSSASLEWQRKNPELYKASRDRYRAKNPTLDRDYYLANKEAINARNRRYYWTNREAMMAANQRWREAHPDWQKDYARRFPHKNAENIARRVARIKAAFVEDVDRQVQFDRFYGICYICFEPVDPDNWHLEHIIPLSRGGAHSFANTGVSHPKCNQQKTDFLPEELTALGWPPLILPGEYYSDDLEPSDVKSLPPVVYPKDVLDRLGMV